MQQYKYAREAALLPHYEAHAQYYSPVPDAVPALMEAFGIDLSLVKSALDIGCGDGRLSLWISQNYGIAAEGVDYSPTRVALATQNAQSLDLPCKFGCQDLHYFLEECDRVYDVVFVFEVLEHLENPSDVLVRTKRLLSDGGCVVGSVPKNMPYVAHLQVYEDLDQVRQRLEPKHIVEDDKHWYCQWIIS